VNVQTNAFCRIATLTFTLAAAVSSLVGGCAPSRTFVLQQPTPNTVHSGFTLKQLESLVKVDPGSQKDFETKLTAKLKEKLGVSHTCAATWSSNTSSRSLTRAPAPPASAAPSAT